ncbi:MAG: sugar ABC transporter permease, partial [Sphaerochaetaceae bacterium]|nr:sugar ABC transporter permease [Sphaerochaetaceae bacterium]
MNNADGIKKPRKRKNQISGFLYILPALFIALLFSYRPFVKTIINSLSIVNYSGTIIDVAGLDNFKRLFADRNFLTSLTNTFRFAVMFVPLNLLVCIILALLVYRKRKGTAFNESLFIMPLSVAMSSAAIVFQALFNPTIGVINFLFNVQVQWFNDPKWAMWVIVILCIWMAMGLDFLLLVGALRSIPKEVLEAAELDGSNRLQTFFHIQIPLISPTLMFVIANRFRDSMLLSGPVLVMTEGGPFRS